MAKKIREFMTHRDPDEHIWVERDENAVIGTARMGQRLVPKIRPFDLLRSAPRSGNRTQVMVWEGDTLPDRRRKSARSRGAVDARRGSRSGLLPVLWAFHHRERMWSCGA